MGATTAIPLMLATLETGVNRPKESSRLHKSSSSSLIQSDA